jgi:hypothetical protein
MASSRLFVVSRQLFPGAFRNLNLRAADVLDFNKREPFNRALLAPS